MPPLSVFALFLGTSASAQPADAMGQGVLVRLEPNGQAITDTPVALLVPPGEAEAIQLTLADDGQPPDVAEADGRWAAAAPSAPATFTVQLTIGDRVFDAGLVSWEDPAAARDLVLTLTSSGIVAQTSTPGGPGPGKAPEGSASTGSPPPHSPPASGMSATPPPTSSTAADDGWLWVALGVGALSLVGGLLLVLRGGQPAQGPLQLERAPEPPIFGPGTPTLQRGLTVWTTPPSDQPRVLTGLLRTLARNHRVLLVLPGSASVPSAFGGPVYVCRTHDPDAIESTLADLDDRPGLPLVVLVVADRPEAAWLNTVRSIMDPDPAAIVLAVDAPSGRAADIQLTLDGSTAQLATSAGTTALRLDAEGFHLAEA